MLTPEQLAIVGDELAGDRYDGLTADAAALRLHATTAEVTTTGPKTLTILGLFGLLSAPSLVALVDWVHLLDLRALVLAQDRAGVALYAQMLVAAGKITAGEYAALTAELAATESQSMTVACVPRLAAIAGGHTLPNALTADEFAAAWSAAGRN